jgi:hypothetical protein
VVVGIIAAALLPTDDGLGLKMTFDQDPAFELGMPRSQEVPSHEGDL